MQGPDRTGEPFVDGAVHESISKHEHHEDGRKRKYQGANYHASAKARTKDSEPAFRIELEQITEENKGKNHQQEENQSGKSYQAERFSGRIRPQRLQVKRLLSKDNSKK